MSFNPLQEKGIPVTILRESDYFIKWGVEVENGQVSFDTIIEDIKLKYKEIKGE